MINQNGSPKGYLTTINNRLKSVLKFSCIIAVIFLSALTSFAQPRWSPEVRSNREIQWLKDSLHITDAQLNKISSISLTYQQEMDKAANLPDKKKRQAKLIKQKDAQMKAILDHSQYFRYFKREELIRKQDAKVYKGHQPM